MLHEIKMQILHSIKGPAEKIVPLHSARIALHKSGMLLSYMLLPLLDYLVENATTPPVIVSIALF